MKDYTANFTQQFGYPEEWHRSDLPHRNKKGLIQFITYRLADSLPQEILQQIKMEIEFLDKVHRDVEKRKKYQNWLDKGLGSCTLSNREMAQKVMDALRLKYPQKFRQ